MHLKRIAPKIKVFSESAQPDTTDLRSARLANARTSVKPVAPARGAR
jgi:hypothetical protein